MSIFLTRVVRWRATGRRADGDAYAAFGSWITSVPVRPMIYAPHVLQRVMLATGTRGATSAEYFLKAGYAVIFMHRQFSLQPFSRHYSHSTHPFLDFLEIDESSQSSTSGSSPRITVRPSEEPQLLEVLSTYKAVQRAGTLLTLNFVTVNDYLWQLRAVSQELSVLGRNCLYYLAAAVSDFFLPRQKMVRRELSDRREHHVTSRSQSVHKIQSGKGSLHIEMDQVPKILKPLVAEWTREGFIVSFKVR